MACCTYNSNEDAKIGIYGIDQKAFTMIDQFITHYNDAVSACKVSVDVKPVKREKDYQNDNRTNTGDQMSTVYVLTAINEGKVAECIAISVS